MASQAYSSYYHPPPPPMPSPQHLPTALPNPPPFPRRPSSRRLQLPLHQEEPPIPPRLIGSPILQRFTSPPKSNYTLSDKAHAELWLDGDEFGSRRKETAHLQHIPPPSSSPLLPPGTPKSSSRRPPQGSSRRSNSRSPPPTPKFSAPPPVPPIPPSAFSSPGSKRAMVRPPSASSMASSIQNPYPAPSGVTCFEFITLHNNTHSVMT